MSLIFRFLCCPGQEIPARLFQDEKLEGLGRHLGGLGPLYKDENSENSKVKETRAPRESLGGLGRPQDPSSRTKTHWQAPSGLDLQRVQDGELWPENAGRVEGDLYRVSIG